MVPSNTGPPLLARAQRVCSSRLTFDCSGPLLAATNEAAQVEATGVVRLDASRGLRSEPPASQQRRGVAMLRLLLAFASMTVAVAAASAEPRSTNPDPYSPDRAKVSLDE